MRNAEAAIAVRPVRCKIFELTPCFKINILYFPDLTPQPDRCKTIVAAPVAHGRARVIMSVRPSPLASNFNIKIRDAAMNEENNKP
jgi:hypothetical protein